MVNGIRGRHHRDIPWKIDCPGSISAGLSICGDPGIMVATVVRGKTGATIEPRPGEALGDIRGARVDIGETGGERGTAGGVFELTA